MIYKLTKKNIFEDNPELKLVPEFSVCTDKQLKYLFLLNDYESPLRKLEDKEKKDKALTMAGYRKEKRGIWDKNARNVMSGKVESIQRAEEVFMSIQNDSDVFMLHAVREQIKEIVVFISQKGKSASEMEKSIKFIHELPDLKQKETELVELLGLKEDTIIESQPEIVENLSTLDKINQNLQ